MQPNPFHSAAKWITKLTGKAKAALDEKLEAKSKKRKNDDSASVDSTQPKKSTRALLCLSYWSWLGLVKNEDILAVSNLADVVWVWVYCRYQHSKFTTKKISDAGESAMIHKQTAEAQCRMGLPAQTYEMPPSTPPQKLRTLDVAVVSPDIIAIRHALQAQATPISQPNLTSFTLRTFKALLRIIPPISLSALIADPSASDVPNMTIPPMQATLFFNPQSKPKYGAFKAAQFGFLEKAILGPSGSDSTCICLKQCYYQTDKCSIWAGALMDQVQQYVATELVTCGTPPFNITNICFVHIALATIEDASVTRTYLIEEFIDESTHGKFTKYISNDSPSPLQHLDARSSEIAQYLSFVQHVQYIKTKKLAYVADFQGLSLFCGRNILTDPQIMTSPDLSGHLFADGNLASAFASFAEKHQCNIAGSRKAGSGYWLFQTMSDERESGGKVDDFGERSMVLGTRDNIS
ncbi:uncharacterized protein EDB93DRAFT_1110793 [Suillus bovinus]|uniref:uncharacterized protein n=1 Tax=Suillus bovinus TaxID=48563 RepID=UPI001B8850B3|nr:uncharacterized protein EDB93DRAFT_1110793 [Suillus bovinus]KAG2123774.1 hypothetical protein EDB93DRAFT_1110793 [Suillus bovinus]